MLGVRLDLQLGHVCYEIDLRLNIPFHFLHDFLTEVSYIKRTNLIRFHQRILQGGKLLDMNRELLQSLYPRPYLLGLLRSYRLQFLGGCAKLAQGRLHLNRYVLDELGLLFAMLVCRLDDFL